MKAVMFDLDDTLVGIREGYIEESIGHSLRQFGVNYTEKDVYEIWFGSNRDEYVMRLVGVKHPKEFWRVFVEYDAERRASNALVFNDSLDVLEILKKRGLKLGIVTSSHVRAADAEIALLGREQFDSVIYAAFTNDIRPKPDPQGLEMCLRELGVDKAETCYVGDSAGDILSSERAGVKSFLLCRNGWRKTNPMPDFFISNLYELLEYV